VYDWETQPPLSGANVRIAVLIWSQRQAGGVEAYLTTVIPALLAAGHAVALVCEVEGSSDRALIAPEGIQTWCLAALGVNRLIGGLKEWHPDILYGHGLLSPALEERALQIAPAAFFAHGFYGTCISGAKSFKAPVVRACDRRFGWPCLVHYYPHRCGGLSPITMAHNYWVQRKRLELLHRYHAIITPSHHMESEYLKHGIPRERVHLVPLCGPAPKPLSPSRRSATGPTDVHHLVFLGRMDAVKGGRVFLQALPEIRSMLRRDLLVSFAGDGPERSAWQREAERLCRANPGLQVTFTGWLLPDQRDALFDLADLLVVPSLFPEPLGLVGIEAARRGLPSAAFAMGGIPDWLEDGVNGFLAPATPATSSGLAEAIAKCLREYETHARLRRGALEIAARHSVTAHLALLEPILESLVRRTPSAGGSRLP
jgi:glycosyltransferase involved in cell wall biosynthesis